MHCHLLIPSLLPPGANTPENDPLHGAHAPALESMLALGKRADSPETEMESWLCERFGIQARTGFPSSYPVAPLCLLAMPVSPSPSPPLVPARGIPAESGSKAARSGETGEGDAGSLREFHAREPGENPGNAAWMRADPVFLSVERDQLILAEALSLAIEAHEAEALTSTLNRHFSEDGLEFFAATPQSWYLRLKHLPAIETHSLHEVAGKHIHPFLPTGEESRPFRSLLNEIQMLLFEHPVNQAREQRGLPPVNSVWLWGAGVLPQAALKNFDAVWSQNCLAAGLSVLSGAVSQPLPTGANEFINKTGQAGGGKHLIVLDQLRLPSHNGDPFAWREQLAALDRDWFAPLKRALAKGKVQLSLHIPGASGTISFALRRRALLQFWLPRHRLSHYRKET